MSAPNTFQDMILGHFLTQFHLDLKSLTTAMVLIVNATLPDGAREGEVFKFPAGVTRIRYVATDSVGNNATCEYTVESIIGKCCCCCLFVCFVICFVLFLFLFVCGGVGVGGCVGVVVCVVGVWGVGGGVCVLQYIINEVIKYMFFPQAIVYCYIEVKLRYLKT